MKTWAERIAAAKKRGRFTAGDKMKADHWATCAVGERFRTRCRTDVPTSTLVILGTWFNDAVYLDGIVNAEKLLKRIQRAKQSTRKGVSPC